MHDRTFLLTYTYLFFLFSMQTAAIILVAIAVVWFIYRPKPEVPTKLELQKLPNKKTIKVRHCKINPQTEEIDFKEEEIEVESDRTFKKGDRIGDNPFDFYVVT